MSLEKATKTYYPPTKHCVECGGICCKTMPGIIFPKQLLPDLVNNLVCLLTTGNYAIDWWEGDLKEPEEFASIQYIRPSTKNKQGVLFDPSWGGECVFLTDQGCSLSAKDRPQECRMLQPGPQGKCDKHGFTKQSAAEAWRPYQNEIKQAVKLIGG